MMFCPDVPCSFTSSLTLGEQLSADCNPANNRDAKATALWHCFVGLQKMLRIWLEQHGSYAFFYLIPAALW
jgi:hypothetical protein